MKNQFPIKLTTEMRCIELFSQQDIIKLAITELEEDVKVNSGSFDDLPIDYPKHISSYNQAVQYLQDYYEGRYLNIKDIALNKYEILSDEDEMLISSNDYSEVVKKFLSYIEDTQQEYLNNGDKDKEEVNKLILDYKTLFENNVSHLNETLLIYGFSKLIVKD